MGMLEKYHQHNQFGKDHNMQCRVIKPGEVEISMLITKKHMATQQVAHGGIISALTDAGLSIAALTLFDNDNKYIATIEFKINFVKPALLNDTLKCIGTVIKQGKTVLVARAEVFNQRNENIAFAQGTLMTYEAG
jgi:uncharacterized protein (TIGR00369 family)